MDVLLHAPTQEYQQSLSPEDALDLLKKGNVRFLNREPLEKDHLADMKTTANGQFPFATLVGCIDSRVLPEMIFDQGIGDIFDCRVAGNVVNEDVLGSLEFATEIAGSKVIVLMGHTKCGAVKGACGHVKMGNLTGLLEKIEPVIQSVEAKGMTVSPDNPDALLAVTEANVHYGVEQLRSRSEILRKREENGELIIIGALYDVGSGKVTWYD